MSIKRVNHGRGHSYVDTDTGEKIPGVTTIISDGIPKPALVNWAANATAEAAIDRWAELDKMKPAARLKTLQGARYAERDTAANRGTQVHELAARLVAGEKVKIPDGLEGYVQSYVRFLDEHDVDPLHVEKTVVSRAHRYCGTLDLIGDLLDVVDDAGYRWLLDVKTNRSGVFGETALQLAAYRYADALVEADGTELDMPEVDRTGVVWVRPDGYDLIPVEAGQDEFRLFLYAQQIAGFTNNGRDLVGEPIVSPRSSTYRLVVDDEERDVAVAERASAEAMF